MNFLTLWFPGLEIALAGIILVVSVIAFIHYHLFGGGRG